MPDLIELIVAATSLPAAIAADLAVAGGILRCPACSAEQPVGDIAGHLTHGWPKCCGYTMPWVTLKMLVAEGRTVPEDCELVPVVSDGWRTERAKVCSRRLCGAVSVAELNRVRSRYSTAFAAYRSVDAWYPYCLEHMAAYGHWIENGQVMHWILREIGNAGA